MSLADTILTFASTYVVARPTGSYVSGRWVETSAATFQIKACIQPAGAEELLRLPEGQRTRKVISIWTETELRTATYPAGARADRITYGGESYEVQAVELWEEGGYYRALAARIG